MYTEYEANWMNWPIYNMLRLNKDKSEMINEPDFELNVGATNNL